MERSKWVQLRDGLLATGWTRERPGSEVLESPDKSLALSPELDRAEFRASTIRSIEQSIETIRGYEAEGHDLEGSDSAIAEFEAALAAVRAVYGDS